MPKKTPAEKKGFAIWENSLCRELRCSKDELRARREHFLVRGKHWEVVNKRVLLNATGAQVLRGTMVEAVPRAPEKNAGAGDCGSTAGRPVRGYLTEVASGGAVFNGVLQVHAVPVRNKRLVVAVVPGADPMNPMNLVSLFVRDNTNFMKGMFVGREERGASERGSVGPAAEGGSHGVTSPTVRMVAEGVFELLGGCPRWRGRW